MKCPIQVFIFILSIQLPLHYFGQQSTKADSTYYRYEIKSGWVSYKVSCKKKKIGRLELFFEEYGSKECFYYQTDSTRIAICKTDSIQFDPFVPFVKNKRKRTLPFEMVNFYRHYSTGVRREGNMGFLAYVEKKIKGYPCTRYLERSDHNYGFNNIYVYKGIPIKFTYHNITFTLDKSDL